MAFLRLLTLCLVTFCFSDLAARAATVTIKTVAIGNPSNAADMRYIDANHPNGVGSVGYKFRMGKTEVTNAQYVEFLNSVARTDSYGLFSTSMGLSTFGGIVRSGSTGSYSYAVKPSALGGTYTYEQKPVNFIDYGDAMRFANWLHNGQPTGAQNSNSTEDGAYTLNGALLTVPLTSVTRNAGARWWLPNEDEWYKAAYHKNDGATGNYWDYPTATDASPDNNLPSSDTGNSANFYDGAHTTGNSTHTFTDAGAYTLSSSAYGTFDQGGNAEEWNETLFPGPNRGYRGGYYSGVVTNLHASTWGSSTPTRTVGAFGFRMASLAIPEPSSLLLLGFGSLAILWSRLAGVN